MNRPCSIALCVRGTGGVLGDPGVDRASSGRERREQPGGRSQRRSLSQPRATTHGIGGQPRRSLGRFVRAVAGGQNYACVGVAFEESARALHGLGGHAPGERCVRSGFKGLSADNCFPQLRIRCSGLQIIDSVAADYSWGTARVRV